MIQEYVFDLSDLKDQEYTIKFQGLTPIAIKDGRKYACYWSSPQSISSPPGRFYLQELEKEKNYGLVWIR